MADAAPALPAGLVEQINARATEQYNKWKTSATPEQKAAGIEKLNKFRTDEEFKNGEMAKMTKAWADADANGDGKLNLEEYKAFDAALKAIALANGEWYEDGDYHEANFNMANSIGEGDGFTMPEMM